MLLRKNNEGFEQKGQVVPPLVTWLNIIHAPHGFLPKQVSLVQIPVKVMNELNSYLINILNFIKNNIWFWRDIDFKFDKKWGQLLYFGNVSRRLGMIASSGFCLELICCLPRKGNEKVGVHALRDWYDKLSICPIYIDSLFKILEPTNFGLYVYGSGPFWTGLDPDFQGSSFVKKLATTKLGFGTIHNKKEMMHAQSFKATWLLRM